jgi:hypothetical protein
MLSRMPNWKMRPKAAIELHDTHELDDEVHRHQAVGIKQYCEIVMLAPARAEVSDISGFETDIVGATAVGQGDLSAPCCCERRRACGLAGGDLIVAGIAQHVDMEAFADAARGEPLQHRLEHARDAFRRLVADAHEDRGRCGNRRVFRHATGNRQDRYRRIARKAHDQKADGRIPEADYVPGQRQREERD